MPEASANTNWFTYSRKTTAGRPRFAAWWGGRNGAQRKSARWIRWGRRLAKKLGDDNHCFREWVRMGDHVRSLGMAAERKGNTITAAAHHQRAVAYYQMGERFRLPRIRKGWRPSARVWIVSTVSPA